MSSNQSRDDVTEEDGLLVEAVSLLVRRQRETESWVAEQVCQAEARDAASERRYSALEARLAGIEERLDRLVREVEPSRGDGDVDARLARLREQVQGLKTGSDRAPTVVTETNHSGTAIAPVASASIGGTNHVTQAPAPASSALGSVGAPGSAAGLQPVSPQPREAAPTSSVSAASPAVAPVAEADHGGSPPTAYNAAAAAQQPAGASSAREVVPVSATAGAVRATREGHVSNFLALLGDTPQDRFGLILIGLGLIAVVYAVLSQLHLG